MPNKFWLSFLLLAATNGASGQTVKVPTVQGVVTRFVSMSDFDVVGKRVVTDAKTEVTLVEVRGSQTLTRMEARPELRLGQRIDVFGTRDKKAHAIRATKVMAHIPTPHSVSGTAVIEAMLPLAEAGPDTLAFLKADGYRIRIGKGTNMKFGLPLTKADEIVVNAVVRYDGEQGLDGVVQARNAEFYLNSVTDAEMTKRKEWDYDPQQIAPDSHQPLRSKLLRGVDPMAFPLHSDAAMQARVTAVGQKLIPQYQKSLSADERTRMNFRFYVVEGHSVLWPLPGGMILVSADLVERTQNDSQLAALLAEGVAHLIERQPFGLPLTNGQVAKSLSFDAAVDLVPFAALAYSPFAIHGMISAAERSWLLEQQRERVALSLMRDAGFDLLEAPKMEWILHSKKPKDIANVPAPRSAVYMYELLGGTWLLPQESGAKATEQEPAPQANLRPE